MRMVEAQLDREPFGILHAPWPSYAQLRGAHGPPWVDWHAKTPQPSAGPSCELKIPTCKTMHAALAQLGGRVAAC
eukprot:363299-Chlamydomonas_euryale.AAC.3